MEKCAIILAAGKGTRMKTELPKCAYPFCEKPMIKHIVDNCKKSNIDDIIVVVGYKKENILNILKDEVQYAYQEEQLGTGHAVMCCRELLKNKKGICLVMPGDMPLVNDKIIDSLIDNHIKNHNDLTVVTTIVDDAKSYGRIYRENNKVRKIVEYKDATSEQLKIKEINSGLYCVDTQLMLEALDTINNNNNSNEYYFTDVVEKLADKHQVDSFIVEDPYCLTGINDLVTLRETEKRYRLYFKSQMMK